MAKIHVVEVDMGDVASIGWAAGVAAGQGQHEMAGKLFSILSRITEIDTDEVTDYDEEWANHPENPEHPDNVAAAEAERTPDPQFMPPPPAPPTTPQSDFGAGRPPGG